MRAILLDTNAVTALLQGDQAVKDIMSKAETVYLSAVVIGELEAGFRGGSRYTENLDILNRLLERPSVEVLSVGRETGECFGRIRTVLKAKGTPIPINDVWIASQCMERGAVLVSYDRHFDAVEGIRSWSNGGTK